MEVRVIPKQIGEVALVEMSTHQIILDLLLHALIDHVDEIVLAFLRLAWVFFVSSLEKFFTLLEAREDGINLLGLELIDGLLTRIYGEAVVAWESGSVGSLLAWSEVAPTHTATFTLKVLELSILIRAKGDFPMRGDLVAYADSLATASLLPSHLLRRWLEETLDEGLA